MALSRVVRVVKRCGILNIFIIYALLITYAEGKGKLVDLDESNWSEILEGEWMVEFFAPWCPACKALTPVWKDFSSWSDDLGIQVGKVDVTANPGLSGRFMVTALPTIYHVKDGLFRQYVGARDKDSFMNFVEEKKWQKIEPIPAWKSPQSYHEYIGIMAEQARMSAVSYFFKLSMGLRSIHTKLVEEFGIPYWGSYIIFALATVILGAILGLMVVCVIDLIFPPKPIDSIIDSKKYDSIVKDSEKIDEEEDLIQDSAPTTPDVRKRKEEDKSS